MAIRVTIKIGYGDSAAQCHKLTVERVTIGKDPSNDIVLDDEACADRHAEIVATGVDTFDVVDLGTAGGTRLNDVPVCQSEIKEGDVIGIGGQNLLVAILESVEELPKAKERLPEAASSAFSGVIEGMVLSIERARKDAFELLKRVEGKISAEEFSKRKMQLDKRFDKLQAERELMESGNQRLNSLLDIFQAVHAQLQLRARMVSCVDLLIESLHADCGCLIVHYPEKNRFGIPVKRGMKEVRDTVITHEDVESETPSTQIIKHALKERRTVYVEDAASDSRFGSSKSVVAQQILSAACVPLLSGDKLLGALYVDYRNMKRFASLKRDKSSEIEYLTAFAGQAALAIENARLAERLRGEAARRERLQRFLPSDVAEQIVGQEEELGLSARRMEATVLCARIPNLRALTEEIPPNQLIPLVNEYVSSMIDVIFQGNGTIHRMNASSLLATFGMPVPSADQDASCAATAVRMQAMTKRLCSYWARKGLPTFLIAIGLHRGDVIAGTIGSERRMEFEVLGDAVDVAEGLCELAPAGKTFASNVIADKVPDQVEAHSIGGQTLAGRTLRTEVYELRPAK